MNKNLKPISESERNINWEEVEIKVAVICSKFKNIRNDYLDDLAQELRVHAFYISDNYQDLYRRAIDFWRTLQCRVYPEVPYFDMELMQGSDVEDKNEMGYLEILKQINKELDRNCYSKAEMKQVDTIRQILEIITDDVKDGRNDSKYKLPETEVLEYVKGKVSIYWVSLRLDKTYRHVQDSLSLLQEIVRGLAEMGKISVDDKYYK